MLWWTYIFIIPHHKVSSTIHEQSCVHAYVSIKKSVLRKLKKNMPEIQERFGIETIELFGSVSRGEDTPDVDVMVSFVAGAMTMRHFMGLLEQSRKTQK